MQTAAPFLQIIGNRTKAKLFLLRKLPAAFFSGVRIERVSAEACTVSVPYGWFTQNPFRSTYFACLSMAAEMSTGALAMGAVYGRKPSVSMLITKLESNFFKKAIGKTSFTCNDGLLFQQTVATAVQSGAPQTVKAYSKGVDAAGNVIAEFWFTWSFKAKG